MAAARTQPYGAGFQLASTTAADCDQAQTARAGAAGYARYAGSGDGEAGSRFMIPKEKTSYSMLFLPAKENLP
jgi:hypothetical protein